MRQTNLCTEINSSQSLLPDSPQNSGSQCLSRGLDRKKSVLVRRRKENDGSVQSQRALPYSADQLGPQEPDRSRSGPPDGVSMWWLHFNASLLRRIVAASQRSALTFSVRLFYDLTLSWNWKMHLCLAHPLFCSPVECNYWLFFIWIFVKPFYGRHSSPCALRYHANRSCCLMTAALWTVLSFWPGTSSG